MPRNTVTHTPQSKHDRAVPQETGAEDAPLGALKAPFVVPDCAVHSWQATAEKAISTAFAAARALVCM